jgi:deoxycytidine triphosphate deaminase
MEKMDSSLHQEWKYIDPHPDDRGILLSNRIHQLCSEGGLLISEEYEERNLRPASYTLRVGDDFVDSDGNLHRLTTKDDSFVFHKNSIIFVTTKEKLTLPYYIVARFNIRVNWVYDGVLLGTGPQVDPGFSGFLSCPLYNLTNVDLTIKRGQDFATIDFEKTTTLLDGLDLDQKREYIEMAKDKELVREGSETYSFYRTAPLKPLQHRKSHRIVSSLFEMREEVRTWRQLGIGSLVAFFGLTLSLLAFGANLYRQYSDLNRQVSEGKSDVQRANERISKLQDNVDRLSGGDKQIVPATKKVNSAKPQKDSP